MENVIGNISKKKEWGKYPENIPNVGISASKIQNGAVTWPKLHTGVQKTIDGKVDSRGGVFETIPRLFIDKVEITLENTALAVGDKKNDRPGESFVLPYTYDTDLLIQAGGILYRHHVHIADEMTFAYASTGTDSGDFVSLYLDLEYKSGAMETGFVYGQYSEGADVVGTDRMERFLLIDFIHAGENSVIIAHRANLTINFSMDEVSYYMASELDIANLRGDMNAELLEKADKQTETGGFAGGADAHVSGGGASLGIGAECSDGGAVGKGAQANTGGAVGEQAYAECGGAVGWGAKAGDGFAGGYYARTINEDDRAPMDAIQLGTGTNVTEKTLQVYDYCLMNADGTIPAERLRNTQGGFSSGNGAGTGAAAGNGAYAAAGGAAGENAGAGDGGTVGSGAYTQDGGAVGKNANAAGNGGAVGNGSFADNGGAVGDGAETSNGFAGGYNAKCISDDESQLDAVQLGTGTNNTEGTFQVYNYRMMNADGTIPTERIPGLAVRIFDHTEFDAKAYDCKQIGIHILHYYNDMPWVAADLPEEEAHGVLFVYDCGNGTGELAKTFIGESGKVYRGTDNSNLTKTEWLNPLGDLEARIAALEATS